LIKQLQNTGEHQMKNGFRQSMAWLHTWTGLIVGWVLFFVFVTGNLGRFDTEIDQWMKPEAPAQITPIEQQVGTAQLRLQARVPDADRWHIYLTTNRDTPYLRIRSEAPPVDDVRGQRSEEYLDPASGAPLNTRATGGGQLLYKMHYELHYLPDSVSDWLIGICSMFMLVAIISGVITHKKIFADFFTFRPGKGQRSWLDLHAVLAVLTLPFFLMITYSGLIFFVFTLFPGILGNNFGFGEKNRQIFNNELAGREELLAERSGINIPLADLNAVIQVAEQRWGEGQISSLEVIHPGDANARVRVNRNMDSPLRSTDELTFDGTDGELLADRTGSGAAPRNFYETLLGLHESLFAGWWLRWLYFLSGLAGAAIIGSGLILWVVKRRPKQVKQKAGPDFGFRLVEGLNVGTIAGLHIAIPAYFLANRLLPLNLPGRAEWEAHIMFSVWLLALLHPIVRPIPRAWVEQWTLAAAAFLLLPLVNALTTERGLIHSLAAGDWVFAGFDLTCIVAAGLFATIAMRLQRRERPQTSAAFNTNPGLAREASA
jgi:uncharacterized iron-regulated membrane protein